MIRTYLDWLIELPWSKLVRGAHRHRRGAPHPRRGPLRPRQDQAAHPRVSRGAQAQRPRARARSCASSARPASARPRSANRSRAPWAANSCASASAACMTRPRSAAIAAPISARCPATSSRRSARPGRAIRVMMLDEIDKLGARLPRRSVGGAARGARPRAELDLPRQLPRGAVRPVARHVHRAPPTCSTPIPGPLRDRMEIIELPGYTEEREARDRQALSGASASSRRTGSTPEQLRDRRRRAPRHHPRTTRARPACAISSARSARSAATSPCAIAEGTARARARSTPPICTRSSGRRRSRTKSPMRTSVPGVATGLAWTPVGGDILFIEATRMPGNGKLILTGQLGDVMKESAQAALSLVKSAARVARHRRRRVREDRHPRARAGRRHPQGRPERGRGHVHRARLAAHRPHGAAATPP